MPESFIRGAMTEATYLVLLSLTEVRHGYGVMQHITALTEGRVNLGVGTLYGAVNLLLEKGWIETAGGDDRRKLYVITPEGRRALEAELARLTELVSIGQEILAPDPAGNSEDRPARKQVRNHVRKQAHK